MAAPTREDFFVERVIAQKNAGPPPWPARCTTRSQSDGAKLGYRPKVSALLAEGLHVRDRGRRASMQLSIELAVMSRAPPNAQQVVAKCSSSPPSVHPCVTQPFVVLGDNS